MAKPTSIPDDLRRLAAAHGVATSYRNERREPVEVDADVVIRVLGLLDVDAATEADRHRELTRLDDRRRAGVLPPTVATRVTGRAHPLPGAALLVGEDGSRIEVDDQLPGDLPPGWYRLHTRDGQEATLVAAPEQVPSAPATWGWMLQLYALRSARSWGIGDLGDLREFMDWTVAAHGAGAVLLNPLSAPGPTHPVQPSPYTPSSRRFANPLALRIEDLDAYRRADPDTRAEVDALRVSASTERIDHDLVWAAKRAALELLWRSAGRPCPLGEDWGLPPWRPDRLAATGYAALRDMLRAVLTYADGLRIDHVAGLWRLWWIPPGDGPDRGTYVHYDADVMLAVLALEAYRAGTAVVGEDLGTVEPEVTEALAGNGMLGCAVSWFTRDESAPGEPLLPPAAWPPRAAASLSTHDLPTAAGFLRGEHVRVRAELGLLDDVPAEQDAAEKERAEWLTLLRSEGLLPERPDEPDEAAIITAMHRFLAATPSRLKLISPYDVIAEPRQPNLPGTIDEYPNWRIPLAETLEQLQADPRVAEITSRLCSGGVPRRPMKALA